MLSCLKTTDNNQSININDDVDNKKLHTLLHQLVQLNIKYNTEFNKITNEINKIKLIKEKKDLYELDSVRHNTKQTVYNLTRIRGFSAPPKLLQIKTIIDV